MKVWWQSGHLPGRRSDLRKSLQTDRRTDRQTDDVRLTIVKAHSWNELKTGEKVTIETNKFCFIAAIRTISIRLLKDKTKIVLS